MSSSSQIAMFADQMCSGMAFFSNLPSSTTTFSSSASSSTLLSAPTPTTDLSSSSSSTAPLRGAIPMNGIGAGPHILALHPDRTSLPSPSNIWAWGELMNQSLLSNKVMMRSDDTIIRDSDHNQQQRHANHKSLLGMSTMKMKKIKGRRKVREPRFCFKTLSDVDVLDDGYKWRKYGQKVVKNTQHPRSYYRCTQDICRVKKRVERLAEDPRMVITTYEGRHAHSPSQDTEESQGASTSHLNSDFFW